MAKAPIDIRSLARSHTETALRTLASIMTMADAPHAARIAAAAHLLDRGWGKPAQPIEGEVLHNIMRVPFVEGSTAAWATNYIPEELKETEH